MLVAAESARDIGATHDMLFQRGIWTKSMVKSYLRCPASFEQRYVYGKKEPPGWALAIGSVNDSLFDAWGRRYLETKESLPAQEARQILSDCWQREVKEAGVKPDDRDPHKTKDAKLGSLMKGYSEWVERFHSFKLGRLLEVQPAYGYDGGVLLGDVPIAGHPDFIWSWGPVDLKTTKSTSPTRTGGFWPRSLDLVFQSTLTGNFDHSGILIVVHDFKSDRMPRIEHHDHEVLPVHREMMTEQVGRVVEAVKKGSFPATAAGSLGKYPCGPTWCGYFGKSCPVTKGVTL